MTTFGDKKIRIFFDTSQYHKTLKRRKRSTCKLKRYSSNEDIRNWSVTEDARRRSILERHYTDGEFCSKLFPLDKILWLLCERNCCRECQRLTNEINCCKSGKPNCHVTKKILENCCFWRELSKILCQSKEFRECFKDNFTDSLDVDIRCGDWNECMDIRVDCISSNCSNFKNGFIYNRSGSGIYDHDTSVALSRYSPGHRQIDQYRNSFTKEPSFVNSKHPSSPNCPCNELSHTSVNSSRGSFGSVNLILPHNTKSEGNFCSRSTTFDIRGSRSNVCNAVTETSTDILPFTTNYPRKRCVVLASDMSDTEKEIVKCVRVKLESIVNSAKQSEYEVAIGERIISELKCELDNIKEKIMKQQREFCQLIKLNEQQQKQIACMQRLENKLKDISQERTKLRGHLECFNAEKKVSLETLLKKQTCLNHDIQKLQLLQFELSELKEEKYQLCLKNKDLECQIKEKDQKLETLTEKLEKKTECIRRLQDLLTSKKGIGEKVLHIPSDTDCSAKDVRIMQEKMDALKEKFVQLENIILNQDKCLHEQHNYILEQESFRKTLQNKIKELTKQQIDLLQERNLFNSQRSSIKEKRVCFKDE